MEYLVISAVLLFSVPSLILANIGGDGGDVCCNTKIIEPLCMEEDEEICMQVEEMKCEIVTWSDCTMRDCPVELVECTSPEPVPILLKKKSCSMVPHVITHTKMRPVCRNETKLNCITLWTMDGKGNKVWAGKDQCEEVNWLKCIQEPYQANFTVKSVCEDNGDIPYDTCKNETSISNQMCIDCKPMAVPKCWTIKREECRTVPAKHCQPQTRTEWNTKVRIPWQEWVNQEKGLFVEDGTLSNSPAPPLHSLLQETDSREGRGPFHDLFNHGERHDHHHDEYGSAKDPEAYGTEPSLDNELAFRVDPDLDVRSSHNVRRNFAPIGIINERASRRA